MLDKKKYIDLKPMIANILDVNTKNGSAVIAKIAGILSNANSTSVTSITTKAVNKGVAAHICLCLMKNRSPSIF